jgi:hypothetical protein
VTLEHGRVAVEKQQRVFGSVEPDGAPPIPVVVVVVVFVVEWIAILEVELFSCHRKSHIEHRTSLRRARRAERTNERKYGRDILPPRSPRGEGANRQKEGGIGHSRHLRRGSYYFLDDFCMCSFQCSVSVGFEVSRGRV